MPAGAMETSKKGKRLQKETHSTNTRSSETDTVWTQLCGLVCCLGAPLTAHLTGASGNRGQQGQKSSISQPPDPTSNASIAEYYIILLSPQACFISDPTPVCYQKQGFLRSQAGHPFFTTEKLAANTHQEPTEGRFWPNIIQEKIGEGGREKNKLINHYIKSFKVYCHGPCPVAVLPDLRIFAIARESRMD